MSWVVHLVETVSGMVGRAVDPVAGSWSVEINKSDSGSLTVKKAELAGLGKEWFTPWKSSVLFSYVTPDGDVVPWCGGPITGWPSESLTELELSWSGIRKIFERRHIERDMKLTGMSLGSIAWEVVKAGMDKPGGGLPIVHGTPTETYSPGHQRTYEAWNLANNIVDKRLTELSEVINGPDMMFRPQWAASDMSRVRWEFVHGTRVDPAIPQTWVPDWDATSQADVVDLDLTSSADEIASRVWGTGAGEGKATVITKAESLSLVTEYFPFLESVISDPDQEKPAPILAKCRAALSGSRRMVDQLSLTVRADSVKNPLTSWWVGDDASVTLPDTFFTVPGGTRDMRVIKASGGLNEQVSVELQEGQWFRPTDEI